MNKITLYDIKKTGVNVEADGWNAKVMQRDDMLYAAITDTKSGSRVVFTSSTIPHYINENKGILTYNRPKEINKAQSKLVKILTTQALSEFYICEPKEQSNQRNWEFKRL